MIDIDKRNIRTVINNMLFSLDIHNVNYNFDLINKIVCLLIDCNGVDIYCHMT